MANKSLPLCYKSPHPLASSQSTALVTVTMATAAEEVVWDNSFIDGGQSWDEV